MEKNIILLFEDFKKPLIDKLINHSIKQIGLHFNPYCFTFNDFLTFVNENRNLINDLEKRNINIVYYIHSISYLLSRDLDNNLYRMDENGKRNNDFNCCVSSNKALKIIEENAYKLAKTLNQKTHDYHYWIDDNLGKEIKCYCDNCKNIDEEKQHLIIYDAIRKGIQKYDKNVKLSYLVYGNKDISIQLDDNYFIEYAPFIKNHYLSMENNDNSNCKEQFLKIKNRYTNVKVLEYLLSYDFKAYLLDNNKVVTDINFYKKNQIKELTTFVVFNKDVEEEEKENGILDFLSIEV